MTPTVATTIKMPSWSTHAPKDIAFGNKHQIFTLESPPHEHVARRTSYAGMSRHRSLSPALRQLNTHSSCGGGGNCDEGGCGSSGDAPLSDSEMHTPISKRRQRKQKQRTRTSTAVLETKRESRFWEAEVPLSSTNTTL